MSAPDDIILAAIDKAVADEIERLRALSDQLAEALRGYYDFGSSDAIEDNAAAALAAYEAARKEMDNHAHD